MSHKTLRCCAKFVCMNEHSTLTRLNMTQEREWIKLIETCSGCVHCPVSLLKSRETPPQCSRLSHHDSFNQRKKLTFPLPAKINRQKKKRKLADCFHLLQFNRGCKKISINFSIAKHFRYYINSALYQFLHNSLHAKICVCVAFIPPTTRRQCCNPSSAC